jgi:hypothetical protein
MTTPPTTPPIIGAFDVPPEDEAACAVGVLVAEEGNVAKVVALLLELEAFIAGSDGDGDNADVDAGVGTGVGVGVDVEVGVITALEFFPATESVLRMLTEGTHTGLGFIL